MNPWTHPFMGSLRQPPSFAALKGQALLFPALRDGWRCWRKLQSRTPGEQKRRGIKIQIPRAATAKKRRVLSKKAGGECSQASSPPGPSHPATPGHRTTACFRGSEGTRQHLGESWLQAGRRRKANKETCLLPPPRAEGKPLAKAAMQAGNAASRWAAKAR